MYDFKFDSISWLVFLSRFLHIIHARIHIIIRTSSPKIIRAASSSASSIIIETVVASSLI